MWRKLMAFAFLVGVLHLGQVSGHALGPLPDPWSAVMQRRAASSVECAPSISEEQLATNLADYPGGQVPQYAKFELAFDIDSTTATNPYFPYDESTPPGVEPATGMTVDVLLLRPGESDWSRALRQPCFYYQPVEEVGSGESVALLPAGEADWRCRFSPESPGTWRYKIQATDACGTAETSIHPFDCVPSDRLGFVRVSLSDSRFFEFSDGTPFITPLVSLEEGNPFNTLPQIRENVRRLGEHGVRFVRWFPTGEGASFFVAPYAGNMRINWAFGDGWLVSDPVDTLAGKKFSFRPYFYSNQSLSAVAGDRYRLSFRATVGGEQVLRAALADVSGGTLDICSSTSTYHESQGERCDYRQDGWHDYSIEITNSSEEALAAAMRGLYVSSDAPAPYNSVQAGTLGVHSVLLQRYEGSEWGPNLLTRSDPDAYGFVDQPSAAKLDEILRLSEQYGVYHKLPLFNRNDEILDRLLPDGSVGELDSLNRNFYSAEGQASRWYQQAYTRYFIARWSYSTALHSLELANENQLTPESYEAGFAFAEFVRNLSPRPILISNSFWGYFVGGFFADPERGYLLDYGDQHWYASATETEPELISNTWDDSAAYVRECYNQFREYAQWFDYRKPIVRGEGGVAEVGTGPQHPEIAAEPQGVYYHKKLWAHVGVLGYTCDGEWYPRLFVPYEAGQFPNDEVDLFQMFASYESFMQGESLNRGGFGAIGTDLTGGEGIVLTNVVGNLRAWGVRRADRVLLWIDNADHTWKNVVDGVSIPPASASLTIQGFRGGQVYKVEWWDTWESDPAQQPASTEFVVAQPDGSITVAVYGLGSDIALKIIALSDAIWVHLPLVRKVVGTEAACNVAR
jgi:hypothetical protein